MGLSSSIFGDGIEDAVKTMKICYSGEEGECEWFERPDHPLLNNLILEEVFPHLSRKELKECRRVCKTWNVATILFTRITFDVTIIGDEYYSSHCNRTIGTFIECFSSNRLGIPFGRFTLGSFRTTAGAGQKFLQMCGPITSSLQFIKSEYYNVEDVFELLRSVPNLATLRFPEHLISRSKNIITLFPKDSNPRLTSLKTLIVDSDCPWKRDEFCPTFLEELIRAAPNISCLDLHDSRTYHCFDSTDSRLHYSDCRSEGKYSPCYVSSSSLQVLILIEELGRESSIQEVTISNMEREEPELIELLRKMSKKPNGLKLSLFHYRSDAINRTNHLITLASHFNDTLQHLYLHPPCSSFMEFRKMHRLKKLSIYLSNNFNFWFVNFSQIFPVVEELQLIDKAYDPDQEYNHFFPESEPCLNVKSLVTSKHRFRINGFKQIVRNFPNLTKLQITVNGWIGKDGVEILRQIWSHMTQLKDLNINGAVKTKDSLDSVLSGISTLGVQEIRDTLMNINKIKTGLGRTIMISKHRDQHCRFPSIANLTDLRCLTLDLIGVGDWGSPSTHVTDLTAYLAFYSMKHLKHIEVKQCELTKTCYEIMIKDMGLESWTFSMPTLACVISSRGNYYRGTHNGCCSFESFIPPCLHNST